MFRPFLLKNTRIYSLSCHDLPFSAHKVVTISKNQTGEELLEHTLSVLSCAFQEPANKKQRLEATMASQASK